MVDQMALAGHDDGKVRFGVHFELAKRVQFHKHLQTEQRGFIDDQHHMPFFCHESVPGLLV